MESNADASLHKNNVSCMNIVGIYSADIWELNAVQALILCEICAAVKHLPSWRSWVIHLMLGDILPLKSKAKEQSDPEEK